MQVFKALHGLVAFTLFSMHESGKSALWDAIGYPGKLLAVEDTNSCLCLMVKRDMHSLKASPVWSVSMQTNNQVIPFYRKYGQKNSGPKPPPCECFLAM